MPDENKGASADQLQRVGEICNRNLNEIAQYFKSEVKLTLVVRTPGEPSRDFILTVDDLDEVAAACKRRKSQMPAGASPK